MESRPVGQKVKHIVVLMLENRSFDHMLGALPGVDGVLDAQGHARTDLFNLVDPTNPHSQRYTPQLGAIFVTPPDQHTGDQGQYGGPAHTFPAATEQLFGVPTVTVAGKNTTPYRGGAPATSPAANAGFVKNFVTEIGKSKAGVTPETVQEVMQTFTAEQLPAIYTLAKLFCVCDRWFSEIPGPTEPNRLFIHTATSTGLTYNPWDKDPIDAPTIYDRINAQGKDWAFYSYDICDATSFRSLQGQPNSRLKFDRFLADAKNGKLPFFSFLCPRYVNSPEGRASSQHAPDDVRFGDKLIADVYQAVRGGPGWESTLLIVTYDEHGGYFDHVPPPVIEAPDDAVSPNPFMLTKGGFNKGNYTFDFTRLGFRVPAVLVSPWIKAGTVDKTEYRHTSILRFIGDLLDSPPLTRRDATARSFASVLSLAAPRADCPATVPFAKLPAEDMAAIMAAPPTAKQQETVLRETANLPGSPRASSDVPRSFATNADLHRYAKQRLQRAEWAWNGEHRGASFTIDQDAKGGWSWHLLDANGQMLASSATSYPDHDAAAQALERTRFLSHMLDNPTP
jgi:phospholipase C